MDKLIGSTFWCVYHDSVYEVKQIDSDWVWVARPDGSEASIFPDAIQFGDFELFGHCVKLPRDALSRLWKESVFGMWRGVEFCLSILSKPHGLVLLGSTLDPAADGLPNILGSQYDGWGGRLPADEVDLTYRKIGEYPVIEPEGGMRREDVKVTIIPFDNDET